MTNTPRTRRQLREALEASRTKELELDAALREATVKKGENTRLRADYAAAQTKLDELGYERSIERDLAVDLGLARPAEVWQLKQGVTGHIAPEEHAHIVDATVRDAVNGARRGVLTTVIRALQITGYGALTTAILNRPETKVTQHDVDRFWADIQTAIEVREEKRVADERKLIEEKVAGLGRGQHPLSFVIPADSINVAKPKLADLIGPGQVISVDGSVGADFAFGSTSRKPTPPTILSRLGQVVITHSAAQEFSVWASDTQDGPAEKVGDLAVGDSLVVSDQPYHKQRWYFVKAKSESGLLPTPSDRVPATVRPLVDADAPTTKKKPAKKKSENKK